MSQLEWYYARDNKQMGPISPAELKRLAGLDEIRPDDLVWREGMTEWAAARNVRGLFDDDGGVAASTAAAGTTAKSGDAKANVQTPLAAQSTRHLCDAMLEKCRAHFNARFLDATAGVFRACGSYGLFAAAALTVACEIVMATKSAPLGHLLLGAASALVLMALQYVAGRSFGAIDHLNRITDGRLSSSLLPDCVAVLGVVGGIAALLGSVASAVETFDYLAIVAGVATFFVCVYLAAVALNWSLLNILVAPEVLAGDEWIGVVMFLLKAVLRLTPVAFGAGVLYGVFSMGFACYLAFAGQMEPNGLAGGALTAADAALRVLIHSAVLPLAAYLVFLVMNLVLSLWRSLLSLPSKLDALAQRDDDEMGRDQPDTVTTHE
jgi:hypothetical protein